MRSPIANSEIAGDHRRSRKAVRDQGKSRMRASGLKQAGIRTMESRMPPGVSSKS